MQTIYQWMGVIQMTVFLLAPLLVPIWLQRYIWLSVVIISYILYFLWIVYLAVSSEIGVFSMGYGRFILYYLVGASLAGYLLQKFADRRSQQDSAK